MGEPRDICRERPCGTRRLSWSPLSPGEREGAIPAFVISLESEPCHSAVPGYYPGSDPEGSARKYAERFGSAVIVLLAQPISRTCCRHN